MFLNVETDTGGLFLNRQTRVASEDLSERQSEECYGIGRESEARV